MRMPSASGLERAEICPASVVLPRADQQSSAASRGSAIHAFLAEVVTQGREKALERVADDLRSVCEELDVESLPLDTVAAEVAFAYDPEARTARELGRDIGRRYREHGLEDGDIAGSADLVGVLPDAVWVADLKTGHSSVTAAGENLQLGFLALCAARVYNRPKAVVEVLYAHDDGSIYHDTAELSAEDLDRVSERIEAIVRGVEREQGKFAAVESLSYRMSESGCRWCPSIRFCGAHVEALRTVEADEVDLGMDSELESGDVARYWLALEAVDRKAKVMRESLKTLVLQMGVVLLGDGRVLREVSTARESLDGAEVFALLKSLYDEETARDACEIRATKAGITKALTPRLPRGTVSAAKRDLLATLRERGGVRSKTTTAVRAVKGIV